jgi:hypothetical protein
MYILNQYQYNHINLKHEPLQGEIKGKFKYECLKVMREKKEETESEMKFLEKKLELKVC